MMILSGEVPQLLYRGVLEAGLTSDRIQTVLPEKEAVRTALLNAHAGDLIVVFYEKYSDVFQTIQQYCQQCQDSNTEAGGVSTVQSGALCIPGINAG